MKNRILCLIILCIVVLSPLFSQMSYKKTLDEGLAIVDDMTDKEGLVLKLKNLRTNTIDTITVFGPHTQPKVIKDIWFNSAICGFILETNSMLLYYLYSKDGSGWRIVGQQVLLIKDESREIGFGGAELLDPYTLVVRNFHIDGLKKVIYQYDSEGNRAIYTQVKYDKTKYERKE